MARGPPCGGRSAGPQPVAAAAVPMGGGGGGHLGWAVSTSTGARAGRPSLVGAGWAASLASPDPSLASQAAAPALLLLRQPRQRRRWRSGTSAGQAQLLRGPRARCAATPPGATNRSF